MATQESGDITIIEKDSAETVKEQTVEKVTSVVEETVGKSPTKKESREKSPAKKESREKSPAKKESSEKDHSVKTPKDGSGDKHADSKRSDSRFPKRRFEQDSNYDRNKRAKYTWQAEDRSQGRSWSGGRGDQSNHQGRPNNEQGGRPYPGQVLIKEADVGMSQFIGSHKGFDGLFKQKFSDIVINEITPSGEIVKIGNTAVPEKIHIDIAIIPKKVRANLQGLLDKTETEDVEVPVDRMSKDDRSKLHLAIRALSSELLTATVEKDGKTFISIKLKDPNEKVTEEQVWPPGKGDYVYFVLHKDNMDTTTAITQIAQLLRINEKLLGFADVKERNAKATQLASVYRIEPEKVNLLNKKLKNVTVGNFVYGEKQLLVGDLWGNSYQLVLRNTTTESSVVEECVKSLEENGFINYFGLGTFGQTSVPHYHVGRALVKSNWKDVVEYVLKPRDGGEDNLRYIRKLYSNTKDANKALRPLQNKQSIEGRLLQGLVKHDKSLVKAVRMIPRSLRAMHVNSYQCYIWNTIASKRIEKHGLKPIVGDLIVRGQLVEQVCDGWYIKEEEKIEIDLTETKNEKSEKEDKNGKNEKSEKEDKNGKNEKSEKEEKSGKDKKSKKEEKSEKDEKSDKEGKSPKKKYKKDTEEKDEKAEENDKEKSDEKEDEKADEDISDTTEEKKEEVAKVEEVVEDEEGWEEDPRYKARVEVVTEANIDKFTIYDVVLPLPGYDSKYPENEVAEWYKEIFEKDGVDFSNKDKLKVYALTGSYRRLVVKPTKVSWKAVNYTNSYEALLLTDYDRMVHRKRTGEVADGKVKAVVLEFSIPPASHAASAVREVLKRGAFEPPPRPVSTESRDKTSNKRDANDSKKDESTKSKSDTPKEESKKADVVDITESDGGVEDTKGVKNAADKEENKSTELNGGSEEVVEVEPMET